MKEVSIVFPHQLFENSPLLKAGTEIYLIEEFLFFRQYNFHKQKIAYHRATMKFYESHLIEKGNKVKYIDSGNDNSDVRKLIKHLADKKIKKIYFIDPTDNWLEKRIRESSEKFDIENQFFDSPLFINKKDENIKFFKESKKKYFQTAFYKNERKKRKIMLQKNGKPEGGKWTFDKENRKKYPGNKKPPEITRPELNIHTKEAKQYVTENFKQNQGGLDLFPLYPVTFSDSRLWLKQFFKSRLNEFGDYEDAIVENEHFLNHSVLTPMINCGLLPADYVLNECLKYCDKNKVPINSKEGFIRQILGWREFIRGIYEVKGTEQRNKNFWGLSKKIPYSFYNATTGIYPVDRTIEKVLKTGYCHHIERLMILANFMLLCEFDPDEVCRWFMEMFIDSYDWVMVPNVYGMSQFADGGLMSTKPYISSSNYILKMSDYKKGEWSEIWDSLFWRFMNKQREFFSGNPRLNMLLNTFDNFSEKKKNKLISRAESFLSDLD